MKPHLRFVYCVALGLLVARPSLAAARVVTTTADIMAPGSLRFEINAAAVGEVIEIPATVGPIITLTLGELPITKSLEIRGPNPSAFSIVNFNGRVFHFYTNANGPVTATVSGIQITGKVTGAPGMHGVEGSPHGTSGESVKGGGILVEANCLVTVSNCIFVGCQVIGGNGGQAYNDPQQGKSLSSRGGEGGQAYGGAAYNFGVT